MARSLDQVLGELEPYYAGSRSIYQSKLDSAPAELNAGIAQADAKLADANTGILDSARRRGLGFSGIPVGEQAKYAATDYAPAIANLKASSKNSELSILEALQGLDRDKRTQGQSLVDGDLARDFQDRQFQESTRQFNETMAANERAANAARAAASQSYDLSKYLGGGSTSAQAGGAAKPSGPQVTNNKGSFAFTSAAGKPITAAQYAAQTNADIRDILFDMGQAGDKTAAKAYNSLRTRSGNDLNTMMMLLAKSSPQLMAGYKPITATGPSSSKTGGGGW